MAYHARKNIVTDGLIFSVDAANKLGGNVTDTKNIVTPTEVGTFTNGVSVINGEFDFNGVDEYIDFPDKPYLDIDDYLTVEGWIYSTTTNRNSFIAKGAGDSSLGGWTCDYGGFNSGQFEFCVLGGLNIFICVGYAIGVNQWQYISVTFDKDLSGNQRLKLYINGEYKNDATYTSLGSFTTILNTNYDLRIGARASTGALPFQGQISNTKIYNKALTATEITQNYEALKHKFE